jgi:hypothetical protein
LNDLKSELHKFYNPTVETARNEYAEKQLSKLNGKSPIGMWVKGYYDGMPVNGFILKIVGYGIVDVYWVKNKHVFEGKGTVIGFHNGNFELDTEEELSKEDLKDLIDLALQTKDYEWALELSNRIK